MHQNKLLSHTIFLGGRIQPCQLSFGLPCLISKKNVELSTCLRVKSFSWNQPWSGRSEGTLEANIMSGSIKSIIYTYTWFILTTERKTCVNSLCNLPTTYTFGIMICTLYTWNRVGKHISPINVIKCVCVCMNILRETSFWDLLFWGQLQAACCWINDQWSRTIIELSFVIQAWSILPRDAV